MKISINLLQYYTEKYKWADNLILEDVEVLSKKIESQIGGIEETILTGRKYEGVIVVKVVSCEQHPNADRLHVCLIDDGGAAS